jgi:transposase-like protein
MTLLRVFASIESGKSVEHATREFGIKRQYFSVWIRRSVTADYTMEGLKEKSQRPHRSPNATPEDVIRQAEESRRMEGSAGHTIAGGEAVRQGGRGGGARHGALHCLLWNTRAATALRIC